MKKGVQKMQQKAEDQMRSQFGQQSRQAQEEGKVTVEKPRESTRRSGGEDDDYIEFEEVDWPSVKFESPESEVGLPDMFKT